MKGHGMLAGIVMGVGVACGFAPAGPPVIRVAAEAFPWADVRQYRTYRWWQPPPGPQQGFTERELLIDWYVRNAVDRELATRGYTPDTAGRPDFVVRYEVGLKEGATSSFQDYMQYRAEGGSKDMGEAFLGYDIGTLTVSFVDVASRRIAWRGRASAVLEGDGRGKLIDPAVRDMMARLPAR
jgi:hypothetical protein